MTGNYKILYDQILNRHHCIRSHCIFTKHNVSHLVVSPNGDDLDQLWKSCCAAFSCEVLNNVVTYIRRSRIVQSSSNREFYVDNFTRSYIFSYLWTGNEIVTDRVSWNIAISTVSKLNKPPKSIRLASPRIQIRRFRDELRFFPNRRAI